ncbi:MAG TPA: hypothetical protein PKD55_24505, partial [Bellilinea sp.]|nr:hypothetical protein [Bellilinea sp.]
METTSQLTQILTSWITNGGDLYKLLRPINNKQVANAEEARAICDALVILLAEFDPNEKDLPYYSPLDSLLGFFQQVETQDAFSILSRDGLPQLRALIQNEIISGGGSEIILFMLKILALYRQDSDVQIIADAAHKPLLPDSFMWSVILSEFTVDHPCSLQMADALRQPIPAGFISIAYLDMVNALCLAGVLETHPFDTVHGIERLTAWLKETDERFFSYALSATNAIPFISPKSQGSMVDLAKIHPDPKVRLEAAWARAKLGDQAGITYLAEMCLEPAQSHTATRYLEELGFASYIPVTAQDPDFVALAEMSAWLAHPMEFGRPPTDVKIFDSRELYWPPTNDIRRLWLIKYCYEDTDPPDEGVGMVGSITFALFGESTSTLSP